MATKKQKREAALAKRAAFEAKWKAQGLAALEKSREDDAAERAMIRAQADRYNKRWRELLHQHGLSPASKEND
jgi:hypothetical protein